MAEGRTPQHDIDPGAWGYAVAPNYFLDFWQPLLGVRAAALYLLLRRFAYGQREECWPSLSRLAASLGMERRALVGRSRQRAGSVTQEVGLLSTLERAGLVQVAVSGQGHGRRYRCRVRKRIPLLTPAQVTELPELLQEAHSRLLARRRPGPVRAWPAEGEGLALTKNTYVLPRERQANAEGETPIAERVWREALALLRAQLPAVAGLLAANARLVSVEGGIARLAANDLARDLLRRRGDESSLRAALEEASGGPLTLEWRAESQDDRHQLVP